MSTTTGLLVNRPAAQSVKPGDLYHANDPGADKWFQSDGGYWAKVGDPTLGSGGETGDLATLAAAATAATAAATAAAAAVPVLGRLLRTPQVLTSGTSYTTPALCNMISIQVQAGGGGGGGADTAAVSGAVGGGGSAGGYFQTYAAVTPALICTYAIGAGGAGGAGAGGNAGAAGGNSTFSTGGPPITAYGGLGGGGGAAGTVIGTVPGGASPAVSSGGNLPKGGAPGDYGIRATGLVAVSGAGGSCLFGNGGAGIAIQGAGLPGLGYGSGGGGACVINGGAAAAGGAGLQGVIVVYEFS